MEGAALADRREYQNKLARAEMLGLLAVAIEDGNMAEQLICQQWVRERSMLEQEKQQLQQQLTKQDAAYRQLTQTYQEELQAANTSAERAHQQVQQLQEQVSQILNTCNVRCLQLYFLGL